MKLRKALLSLPILLIAAVAQASPVGMTVTASESYSSASIHSEIFQATSTVRLSNSAMHAHGFISSALPSPIPEPATLALFGTGLIGVATMIRRRAGRRDNAPGKK